MKDTLILFGKQREERARTCDDVFSSPRITGICIRSHSATPSKNTIVTSY